MPPPPLLLGLDAGGTKTALLARSPAGEAALAGPGANLQRDGLDASADTLADLVTRAVADGVPPHVALCAGVAGAGRDEEARALADALRLRLEVRLAGVLLHIDVTHDGVLALEAAFGPEDSGVVAVVGTGSVLLARTAEGGVLRAAGWGERLGDHGSGTALGRAALVAVADAFDGGEPTALRDRLAAAHGVREADDLIRLVYGERLPFSTLAPLVLEAAAEQDWAATRLLQREANALAQRAGWLAARAGQAGTLTPRLAFLGGLADVEVYRAVLAEAFLRYLPGAEVVRPPLSPVEAALARAGRLAEAQAIASGG